MPMDNLTRIERFDMGESGKRLYLDVCTLCRPYDDQSLLPIRLETEAYYLITSHINQGRYVAVASFAHFAEVSEIEDVYQRVEIEQILRRCRAARDYSIAAVRKRAEELARGRFGVADAAHVAFAEATADVLITCDKGLIKRCRSYGVTLEVCSPLEFVTREDLK